MCADLLGCATSICVQAGRKPFSGESLYFLFYNELHNNISSASNIQLQDNNNNNNVNKTKSFKDFLPQFSLSRLAVLDQISHPRLIAGGDITRNNFLYIQCVCRAQLSSKMIVFFYLVAAIDSLFSFQRQLNSPPAHISL